MSLNSIIKYIFSNQEYNEITAWAESVRLYNEIVWKEFLNRIGVDNSTYYTYTQFRNGKISIDFDDKEFLYSKRSVLDSIDDIYRQSELIKHSHPEAYQEWTKINQIVYSIKFPERERLIREKGDIIFLEQYLSFEEKFKDGIAHFLKENPQLTPLTLSDRRIIYDHKNEINQRQYLIHEISSIKSSCRFGFKSYLSDSNISNTGTLEILEKIYASKAEIQTRDKVIREYRKIERDFYTALKYYQSNKENISFEWDSYLGQKHVVSVKDKISSINNTFLEFEHIQKSYRNALKVFLQTHEDINVENLKGKEYIVANKTEIVTIHIILDEYRKIQRTYSEALKIFLQKNSQVNVDSFEGKDYIVKNKDKIIQINVICKEYKKLKELNDNALSIFLQKNNNTETDSFEGIEFIVSKKEEIIRINEVISQFENIKIIKSLLRAIVYFFELDEFPDLNSYDMQEKIVSSLEELYKVRRKFSKFDSFRTNYPYAYPLFMKYYEDDSLSKQFPEDDILKLKRALVPKILANEKALRITEEFILLSKKYSKRAVEFITNKADASNFSDASLKKKQSLIDYHNLFAENKDISTLEVNCDIEDKNTKVRCILNSDVYGNAVTFTDSFTIPNFYNFAKRIGKYDKSFDEIHQFRQQNAKAVKAFNESTTGKSTFYIEDFYAIGEKDPQLYSFIEQENINAEKLKNALEKVDRIKDKFPYGFASYKIEKGWNSVFIRNWDTANDIIKNVSRIEYLEYFKCAEQLKEEYPYGYKSVYSEIPTYNSQLEIYKLICSNRNRIINIQQRHERELVEQERRRQEEQRKIQEFNSLKHRVSDWPTLSYSWDSLPYNYIINYYPTTCSFDATDSEWEDRKLIWRFKNDPYKTLSSEHSAALDNLLPRISDKLKREFGESNLRKITLVCIPASSSSKNDARFREFSERLCNMTGMTNAFHRIYVMNERESTHTGGNYSKNYSLDSEYFKERYVIIFDDLITRGRSMIAMKRDLENCGAKVICGFSVGKTKHNRD